MTDPLNRIRIVVVDDHAAFRGGVVEVLASEPDIHVVGEGSSAAEAIEIVQRERPDVVVLDMNMPGGGLAAVARLTEIRPEVTILLFTVVADADQIQTAVDMGAGGYLQKGVTGAELVDAVRKVYTGSFFASSSLVSEPNRPEV